MHELYTRTTAITDDSDVKETSFKQFYPGINRSVKWNSLKPVIDGAFDTYIRKYVGDALIDDVLTDYIAEDGALTAKEIKFSEWLNRALAYYTIYDAMPLHNFSFGDLGLVEQGGMDTNTMSVQSWRYKNSRWEIMLKADIFLDMALEYLESEVIANNTDFDSWKNSDAFTENVSDFIRTTRQVSKFKAIKGSRRTFTALVPYFKKAERQIILKILCQDQYDDLATDFKNDELDGDQKKLLYKVQNLVVERGVLLAVPHLTLDVEADGLFIVSSTSDINMRKNAYDEAIARLEDRMESDAKEAEGVLRNFLVENVDTFTLWKNSPCYIEDGEWDPIISDPDGGAILFS